MTVNDAAIRVNSKVLHNKTASLRMTFTAHQFHIMHIVFPKPITKV